MIDLLRPPAVLVYHGVGSEEGDSARLIVEPGRLESHIRFLQRVGYRFLTAEELLDEGRPRARTAVLSASRRVMKSARKMRRIGMQPRSAR